MAASMIESNDLTEIIEPEHIRKTTPRLKEEMKVTLNESKTNHIAGKTQRRNERRFHFHLQFHFFFFPALPSEHGAWSVNSRGMRKQKRVKQELHAGVISPAMKAKQKHSPTNKNPTNAKKQKEPVKILAKVVKPTRPPKPLNSSLPPSSVLSMPSM